ncbi:MAG: PEFG-CTERM sorting domain-containing protein [Thaumarchaeota archaeon]|nr:PEFG-CTERM sorting domain-containing protein [Nitrososphaerota archaeon]
MFLNHDGDRVLNNLKETYVSFSYDELFIQNPNGIIESATMDTILVGDDKKFTFNVTFAQTFDTSDILIRSWDVSGNQSTLYFPDALKIVQGVVTTSIPVEETTNLDTSVDTSVDTPVDAITPLDDVTNEITPLDDVTNEITSTLPYSIMLGGTEDIIPYGVTGAMVTGAMVNLDNNSILFNLVDADNGILTVSPSTETQDGIFMVLVDGEEANDVIINGNDVTVNFPAGTDTIEIIGTFVIPEFGTVAMMILIISIVSIIAITGKSRLSLRV